MSDVAVNTVSYQVTGLTGYEVAVRSFSGEEAISKLFRFRVEASICPSIAIVDLLGHDVKFTLQPRTGENREFLAKIASVEGQGKDEHGEAVYILELVPRIWALTRNVRARVFVDLDPIDIIAQVFGATGVTLVTSLIAEPRVRPYCVQYFETDFDFAVRLIEEEGYVYVCGHDETGNSTFTISDSPVLDREPEAVAYYDVGTGFDPGISSWRTTRVLCATSALARDHFFEDRNSPALEGQAGISSSTQVPGWEPLDPGWEASIDRYPGNWAHLFEYVDRSGNYKDPSTESKGPNGTTAASPGYKDFGKDRVLTDLRQVAGPTSANEGRSNTACLIPGICIEMDGDSAPSGTHLVVSVRHEGAQGSTHSNGGGGSFRYDNLFVTVPYAETGMMYLPPRSTRKPFIHGCQTAIVVGGNDDDEIWTDQYGRVQVQFWWDRGEECSCWVRVATSWAGSHWGVQHIPRVGQEVVVTFLDGDPDRPLIVGSVYNPSHMPPFDLPANKTQSGIRTRSTPGPESESDPVGFNEIRFEDAAGKEQIYIHAERDRDEVVKKDATRDVGGNSGDEVDKDRYDVVKGNLHLSTGVDKREQISGASDLTIEKDSMNYVGGNLGIHTKSAIHLKAETIVIEANTISLRTPDGGSREFIHLEKGGGITIDSKGEKVWINTGGAPSPSDGCYKNLPAKPEKYVASDAKPAPAKHKFKFPKWPKIW